MFWRADTIGWLKKRERDERDSPILSAIESDKWKIRFHQSPDDDSMLPIRWPNAETNRKSGLILTMKYRNDADLQLFYELEQQTNRYTYIYKFIYKCSLAWKRKTKSNLTDDKTSTTTKPSETFAIWKINVDAVTSAFYFDLISILMETRSAQNKKKNNNTYIAISAISVTMLTNVMRHIRWRASLKCSVILKLSASLIKIKRRNICCGNG